jgi:hypothetical protein
MHKLWKKLRLFVVILIATSVHAATYSPDADYLPVPIVSWAQTCSDEDAIAVTDDNIDDLCKGGEDDSQVVNAEKDSLLCGTKATKIREELEDLCEEHYAAVKAQLKNECEYVAAYKSGIDLTFLGDSDWEEEVVGCFFQDGDKDGVPLEPGFADAEFGCEDTGCSDDDGGDLTFPLCKVVKMWGVKFKVVKEPDCVLHDVTTDDKTCPQCFEDRGNYNDPSHEGSDNPDRDPLTASAEDAAAAGGYIFSQGCFPEAPTTQLTSIGGDGADINVGEVLQGGFAGVVNVMLPDCAFNPLQTPPPYDEFENHGVSGTKQQDEVYSKIDDRYDEVIDSGQNPYKGNCGRGKFFYKNLDAKDSNFIKDAAITFDTSVRVEDGSDIWESKTGCYNPEERFVIFPSGQVTEPVDGAGHGPIEFYDVNRKVVQPTDDPTGALADLVESPGAYLDELVALIDPTNDTAKPWDEPLRKDDGTPEKIKTDADTNYLIPNDRVLMRHKCCGKKFDSEFDFGLSEFTKRQEALECAEMTYDEERIYKYGSVPVCVADDFLDERESFCSHYLKRANETMDLDSDGDGAADIALPVNFSKNYTSNRYVFDYTDFCWKKEAKANFIDFDPEEHWMPLAIRATEDPTQTTQLDDIFGNTHEYKRSDYKRPTFTPYSEREVRDEQSDPDTASVDYVHQMFSLEEYGYRDLTLQRKDYQFNPNNIYAPDSDQTFNTGDLLETAKQGRKQKMQQCLRMYLEQWAFEGDKGAIVLDTDQKLIREATGAVTPDSSMCQWVAYYDTSDNYGDSDDAVTGAFKQRSLFKNLMLDYFAKVQYKNNEYREDVGGDDINLGFILSEPPTLVTLTSYQAAFSLGGEDPERLRSSTVNDPNALTDTFLGENIGNMNDDGFRRRRGLRPEIFDYYNFLSFSALAVMPEEKDVNNGTRLGDGNPLGEELAQVVGAGQTVVDKFTKENADGTPSSDLVNSMESDLYTPQISTPTDIDSLDDLTDSTGWQINMERRNCKSVVPPHFWKDVIQPFKGCDFSKGSVMVNSLVDSTSGAMEMLVELGGDTLLNSLDSATDNILGEGYDHWMTTNINQGATSLTTIVPSLPVFAYGFNAEHPFYFKDNWEKFKMLGEEGSLVYIEDAWLGRAGGRAVLPAHVVEKDWAGENGVDDDDRKQYYEDFGGDAVYNAYSEVGKDVNQNARLGMVVVDEKDKISSREWVEHTWPARTCMHYEPINLFKFTGVDPTGLFADSEGIISEIENNINDENPGGVSVVELERQYFELPEDSYSFEEVFDAWRVGDDINLSRIPIFNIPDAGVTGYLDNKEVGGFKVRNTDVTNWFEWMPHAWSLAIGINKAFWCEFEVPYNPFFTGNNPVDVAGVTVNKDYDFDFNKTNINSHFWINRQKNILEAADEEELAKAKPKLELYRVERIRDTCGPFGVRSTWVDDPNTDLGKWLLGEDSPAAKSRCADWIDVYRKGVTDPKIISWRLPRFDYEFLKSICGMHRPR